VTERKRPPTFLAVWQGAVHDAEMPWRAKYIALLLPRWMSRKRAYCAYPSVELIATRANLSTRTVQRALRELEARTWIRSVARKGHAKVYQPCLPEGIPTGDSQSPPRLQGVTWGREGVTLSLATDDCQSPEVVVEVVEELPRKNPAAGGAPDGRTAAGECDCDHDTASHGHAEGCPAFEAVRRQLLAEQAEGDNEEEQAA
jgi:DNA-binding transcriptional MocR family regulator